MFRLYQLTRIVNPSIVSEICPSGLRRFIRPFSGAPSTFSRIFRQVPTNNLPIQKIPKKNATLAVIQKLHVDPAIFDSVQMQPNSIILASIGKGIIISGSLALDTLKIVFILGVILTFIWMFLPMTIVAVSYGVVSISYGLFCALKNLYDFFIECFSAFKKWIASFGKKQK